MASRSSGRNQNALPPSGAKNNVRGPNDFFPRSQLQVMKKRYACNDLRFTIALHISPRRGTVIAGNGCSVTAVRGAIFHGLAFKRKKANKWKKSSFYWCSLHVLMRPYLLPISSFYGWYIKNKTSPNTKHLLQFLSFHAGTKLMRLSIPKTSDVNIHVCELF